MQSSEPCPLPSIYHLTGATGGCVYRVDVGCQNSSVIHVESAAICSDHRSPFFSSQCQLPASFHSATLYYALRLRDVIYKDTRLVVIL